MKMEDFVCGEKCPHYKVIKDVEMKTPDEEEILDLADMFKIFSDSTRLRIILAIINTELCVCDLCELLKLNQSTVSHQLQILRTSKLVKYRKEGKQVFYSLQDGHVEQIISQALEHIQEGGR